MSSLVGGLVSGVGGLFSSRSQDRANSRAADAAAFRPFNINGAGGRVMFGPGDSVNASLDPTSQLLQSLLTGNTVNALGGGGAGDFLNFANGIGNSAIPGLFQGALDASGQIPTDAVNEFSNFSNQNAGLGLSGGLDALGLARGFGTSQTGANEGIAQGLFGQGFNALNNSDFSSLAASQLDRQRALARPGEERAVNAKFQNLFNNGSLGFTSGQRQIGELALSQELADINRVNSADNFANTLSQQNRQFGLGSIGAGLGARGQDQNFNLGAAGLFSGLGQNLLNFGSRSAESGLGAQLGLSGLVNDRAQQRLSNATSLFGFGNNLQNQNFTQALGGISANSQINSDLRNLIALSGNLSGAASNAGANQAQFLSQQGGSPLGSFLQGFGGSNFFGAGGPLSNLIGG